MKRSLTRVDGNVTGRTARRRAGCRTPATALVALVCAVAGVLAFVPAALAKTYSDVPKGFWDRAEIAWVTNQGPTGIKVLNDYSGGLFKPNKAITRRQLARALVVASGHQNVVVATPRALADVPAGDRDAAVIQIALRLQLMTPFKDGFHPDAPVLAWQADRAVVRTIKVLYPDDDWTVLKALNPAVWEPVAGWKMGGPRYLPSEVVARALNLRYNHSAATDAQEVSPTQAIGRDEVAYLIYHALHVSSWQVDALANYDAVKLPALTARQKKIVKFAFAYVGYPYVWGGEYPTKDSPYGTQAHGGFDCSGFDWWVMKMHFGYAISQRVAADMARAAKPRITRAKLVPGDLIFFGPNGPKSTADSIYHAALYLGNGWFIHSTGSFDGVGLSSLTNDSYWKSAFAWGRRVLKAGQFTPVSRALQPLGAGQPQAVPGGPAMPIAVPPDADPADPSLPADAP